MAKKSKSRKLKTVTMKPKKKGQKAVTFKKGGLHRTTGTPMGQKIPMSKVMAAKAGKFGPLGVEQANMAMGMLAKGRATRKVKFKKGKFAKKGK